MLSWQEPIVALIVGVAIVSLYRHLRGMFAPPANDGGGSCHGCDDCGEGSGRRAK